MYDAGEATAAGFRQAVSYDKVAKILQCYTKRQNFIYSLQYNAAAARKGREIFIFSDDLKLPSRSVLPFVNRALARIQKRAAVAA
jgi:hypothetical protein